jgi:hypothetical protein
MIETALVIALIAYLSADVAEGDVLTLPAPIDATEIPSVLVLGTSVAQVRIWHTHRDILNQRRARFSR